MRLVIQYLLLTCFRKHYYDSYVEIFLPRSFYFLTSHIFILYRLVRYIFIVDNLHIQISVY